MFSGVEVANFKTFNSHVTLIVNGEYALSSRRSEMVCIEDRRFARIASESNESIACIAGYVDANEFFVDATTHIDRTSGARTIRGLLNGAPWCSLGARI